jgi:hypothetical protein
MHGIGLGSSGQRLTLAGRGIRNTHIDKAAETT